MVNSRREGRGFKLTVAGFGVEAPSMGELWREQISTEGSWNGVGWKILTLTLVVGHGFSSCMGIK